MNIYHKLEISQSVIGEIELIFIQMTWSVTDMTSG